MREGRTVLSAAMMGGRWVSLTVRWRYGGVINSATVHRRIVDSRRGCGYAVGLACGIRCGMFCVDVVVSMSSR